MARTIGVICKGDMGRLVPIPESFARVLGIQLADKPAMEYVFAKAPGGGQSYGPGDGLSNGPNVASSPLLTLLTSHDRPNEPLFAVENYMAAA